MRVSLIITTYNRPDALSLVLKSVRIQKRPPDEVIIADDGSSESTSKCIAKFKDLPDLNLIHVWQEDKGFRASESRNNAISKSSCEYIILIDGDMVLHSKFIEDHIAYAQSGFFVQGSRVLLNQKETKKALMNQNTNFSFFSKGLRNRKNAIHSKFLSRVFKVNKKHIKGIKACNLAFFKQDCEKVNGFNNDIVGWGREDSEFAVRLLNNGVKQKNIHFNLIQFHLWHSNSSRESLTSNQLLLDIAIKNQLIWCENGLNKFN